MALQPRLYHCCLNELFSLVAFGRCDHSRDFPLLADICRDEQEFVSDVYRERPIAILQRYGRWHVYLDHVLQHNVVFATADHAIAWLMARIDEGIPARLN